MKDICFRFFEFLSEINAMHQAHTIKILIYTWLKFFQPMITYSHQHQWKSTCPIFNRTVLSKINLFLDEVLMNNSWSLYSFDTIMFPFAQWVVPKTLFGAVFRARSHGDSHSLTSHQYKRQTAKLNGFL